MGSASFDSLPAVQPVARHTSAPAVAARPRLAFIDGFRAVAILTILVSHSQLIAFGEGEGDPSQNILRVLVAGNTALFVFVTGLLVVHLAPQGFAVGPFWAKKARNVLIPAAWWIGLLALLLLTHDGAWLAQLDTSELGSTGVWALALERALTHSSLWYIPFVCLLYLVAPPVCAMVRRGGASRNALLVAALVVGLTINRSPDNADKLQNLGYFAFFFVFGAAAAANLPSWVATCRRAATLWGSLAVIVLLAWLQVRLGHGVHHSGAWFADDGPDLHYLQKIAQCVFFCALFIRFPALVGPPVRYVAAVSFGLFFVHELWISLLRGFAFEPFANLPWFLAYILASGLLVGLSLGTVGAIRRLAGPRARWLLGP